MPILFGIPVLLAAADVANWTWIAVRPPLYTFLSGWVHPVFAVILDAGEGFGCLNVQPGLYWAMYMEFYAVGSARIALAFIPTFMAMVWMWGCRLRPREYFGVVATATAVAVFGYCFAYAYGIAVHRTMSNIGTFREYSYLLVGLTFGAPALRFMLSRPAEDPLRCASSGYLLAGLPKNICPECGTYFVPSAEVQQAEKAGPG